MPSSQTDSAPSRELVLYRWARPKYSAASLAELARVHPEIVLCYWKLGLLRADEGEAQGLRFNDDALFLLKQLERLRNDYGLSFRALRLLARTLRSLEG